MKMKNVSERISYETILEIAPTHERTTFEMKKLGLRFAGAPVT